MPLVLCGTPIGSVDDASERLRATLMAAHVVAAEDTRRFRDLVRRLEIAVSGRVVSYFAGNEQARVGELVEAMRTGATVALVTDAGMPGVSDPGYLLVRAALDAGLPVTVVPGPSAVTAALAVSGLPTDRFVMEGFLPRRPGERSRLLAQLAAEPRTLVVLESPRRIAATLGDLADALGADRAAAVCRELTKTYEQVLRGGLGELAAQARAEPLKGEITVVIAGAPPADPTATADLPALAEQVQELVDAGSSRRDAVTAVAGRT
ncbi:MAG TPA: 16S rRNA (cytidine(1402)-2'-O)-methyltransferase, partial [Mycobacteriales bacterium]|nr:16S rRNA (cytidine(1402)-2'-O)-methyltransferase [Mycobacteriales bacterium]